MNDTQTAPAAAPTGGRTAPQCPPWCTDSHDDEPARPVHRTARTAIALPGCTGYLSTRCIEFCEPGPEAVVHGSWQDGGAETHCGLYVPLPGAEDLAALLEILAHAGPAPRARRCGPRSRGRRHRRSGPVSAAAAPGVPDFRHYAGQCTPQCRAAACRCGHCIHDHAIALADGRRSSCTTGCGCPEFADSGLSVQARALIGAVQEAVGIPYGASARDGERCNELLARRVMHLTVMLKAYTDSGGSLAWHLGYLRERLATCPVDYRTDYGEVLAGLRAARAGGEESR